VPTLPLAPVITIRVDISSADTRWERG
jgi:hypothetical protein